MAKFSEVLLVEDDPITIMVCDRIIKMNAFSEKVISCENGKIALDYLYTLRDSNEMPSIIFFRHQYAYNEWVGFFGGVRKNQTSV